MAQIILDENFENNYDESYDEIDINNDDILNYKGYFIENEDEEEEEQKYFEYGAHFPYKFLYQKLEILKEEREEEKKQLKNENKEKKKEKENIKDNNNNAFQNIFNCFKGNKGKSRNRDNNNEKKNGLTFIPKNDKNEKEKINNNNEENKQKEHNASVNVIHNKYKEKTFENNIKNDNINLYNSFAQKLKIHKHLNYSKKDDDDNLKNNNKTISTNSKKIKSIQLSREHLNKVYNLSNQQKNKLEKKIKSKENTFKKLNGSKSKELSSSYHHNSNYNLNNIQNKFITGSLNNIVSNYKKKHNINFSPSLNLNSMKIIQKNNNNNNALSRNYNFMKNPNNTKNIVNKVINYNTKVSSDQLKKNLTISTENQDKKNNNNFQEILLSITNGAPFNKSRNKGSLKNNLTTTKSNLITDRDNSQNLTHQNLHSPKNNYFNKTNNNNLLQTQPMLFQKKKISQIKNDKNEKKISINSINQKSNNNIHNIQSNYPNVNNNIINLNKKKIKGFFNVKINLCQKTQNKIIDEIKKTMTINNIGFKSKNSSNLSNKKQNQNQKNLSHSRLNNIQQPITRNRVTTANYNSKTTTNNLFNHQKQSSQPSNNINININNSNKIIYNKIIDMTNKITITKNKGKLYFFNKFIDGSSKTRSLSKKDLSRNGKNTSSKISNSVINYQKKNKKNTDLKTINYHSNNTKSKSSTGITSSKNK